MVLMMTDRASSRRWLVALGLLIGMGTTADAQYFRTADYWKTHRGEITVGLGASNFLGELGGRNQIGTNFIWDLEISQTRPAISLAYRYYLRERLSLRTTITYGVLAGNDNLTTEYARNTRNLSFKSDLFEGAVILEYHPFLEELGHLFDLRGVKGTRSSRIGLYGFVGVGACYFDPKAKFNNTWVRLRPLHTEGQGLPNGPAEYSNFSICIPMGIGIRKQMSKQISLGVELQYSKTFTDYIDDVSGNYYDNTAIRDNFGDIAAYLADPNLTGGRYGEGEQRGDPTDNDAYLFFKLQMNYKLYRYKSRNKHYRTRLRRQKIVF